MDFDMLRDKLKEKKKEHQVARRNAVDPPRERSREPRGENDRSKRDAGAGNGENKSSRRDVDALLDHQRGGNKKDKDHRVKPAVAETGTSSKNRSGSSRADAGGGSSKVENKRSADVERGREDRDAKARRKEDVFY